MIELMSYIIKSILTGLLLFGFYHFAMRKETFLRLNRWYLLLISVLIIVLPLFDRIFPSNWISGNNDPELTGYLLPVITIQADRILTAEQEQSLLSVAQTGYLIVTLSMLAGFMAGIFRIVNFFRKAGNAPFLTGKIFLMDEDKGPFSFMGRIFIPKNYVTHPDLNHIITHEDAHIRQHHMADLFLLEILSRTLWFNPVFVLIKAALRETHEYLADRAVLEKGVKPVDYQMLLFNEISGNYQYILANNFSLLTKKRIIMLTKISSKNALLKIMMLLPFMAAFTILISAIPVNQALAQESKPVKKTEPVSREISTVQKETPEDDPVFTVVDKMPQFPGGEEARIKYMSGNIKYPEAAKKAGVQGTVYVTFVIGKDGSINDVKVLRGIGSGCDEEAIRVIKGMPFWSPGEQRGQPVKVQFNMPIKFSLEAKKPK